MLVLYIGPAGSVVSGSRKYAETRWADKLIGPALPAWTRQSRR